VDTNQKKQNIKRGYLHEDFQVFHIRDKSFVEFEYHYHDFQKIVIFVSGDVTYLIEGKSYKLNPWDVLFLSSSEVHKPIIDPSIVYERIIIWLNEGFYEKYNKYDIDLSSCFKKATDNNKNLMRMNAKDLLTAKELLRQLEYSRSNAEFGSKLLNDALLIQLLVHFNRVAKDEDEYSLIDVDYNKKIEEVILYINSHLDQDLSIDHLASVLFMSKYYLMHKFKEETGHTIHQYVLQKRMFKASELIKNGTDIKNVHELCGFKDHSSFFRAFKKVFGKGPRDYRKKQ
jgi:AraC-like DNA-binding protein